MKNLTTDEKLVFSSIKINPSDAELEKLNVLVAEITDWKQAEKLLLSNNAAQFLYRKLPILSNKLFIPDEVLRNLKQAYLHTFRSNYVLYEAFAEFAKICDENGIKIVPLKGIYLAEKLYSDIGLRKMSDIDLLVAEKDAGKALKILDEMGYKPDKHVNETPKESMWHFAAMRRGKVSFEIKTLLEPDEGGFLISSDIFASIKPIMLNGANCCELDFYDNLIYLCLHTYKHFDSGFGVSFTGFYDIVNLLNTNETDWKILTSRCEHFNCCEAVFMILLLAKTYFNVNLSDEIGEKYNDFLPENEKKYFLDYLYKKSHPSKPLKNYLKTLRKMKTVRERWRFISQKTKFIWGYHIKPKLRFA